MDYKKQVFGKSRYVISSDPPELPEEAQPASSILLHLITAACEGRVKIGVADGKLFKEVELNCRDDSAHRFASSTIRAVEKEIARIIEKNSGVAFSVSYSQTLKMDE